MSDYLWDKTGEPEEDVKRLEELLGRLSFQPRTLEVPTTLPVLPRQAARSTSNFSRRRLAVAASLALTLLAGAWLVFTKQKTTNAPTQATAEKATPSNTNQLATAQPGGGAPTATKESERREAVERNNVHESIRRQRRELAVAVLKRPAAPQRQSTVRDASTQREQVATNAQPDAAATLTPQEREALEKFALAMRVTSEKLSYAERQMQSMREPSPQR